MVWVLVGLLGVILVAQLAYARRCSVVLRYVLIASILYDFLAYVARPLLILICNPIPKFADAFADPRLLSGGSYGAGLSDDLRPVCVGVGAYLLAVILANRKHSSHEVVDSRGSDLSLTTAYTAYVVCWAARLAYILLGGSQVLQTISLGGSAIAAFLLTRSVPRIGRVQLIVLVALEITWATAVHSKTPALAILFAVALRAGLDPSRPKRRFGRTLATVVLLGLLVGVTFIVIQDAKTSVSVQSDLAAADASYPTPVRPVLPILRRFDLLVAVTDAVDAKRGSYLAPTTFAKHLIYSLIPRELVPSKPTSSGSLWNTEVRGQSLQVTPGVSLADGPVAEGYVVGGYPGVVLESIVLGFVSVGVARTVMSRRVFPTVMSLTILLDACLFERGVLGVGESVGKAIQIGVMVVVLNAVTLRSPIVASTDVRPQLDTQARQSVLIAD